MGLIDLIIVVFWQRVLLPKPRTFQEKIENCYLDPESLVLAERLILEYSSSLGESSVGNRRE